MNELNLTQIAMELLKIHNNLPSRFKNAETKISDFKMETFTQTWGNTSGGFGGVGGCAITEQRVYVFLPVYCNENCFVYFGDRFAYSVSRHSKEFTDDVRNRRVAGVSYKGKYFTYEE